MYAKYAHGCLLYGCENSLCRRPIVIENQWKDSIEKLEKWHKQIWKQVLQNQAFSVFVCDDEILFHPGVTGNLVVWLFPLSMNEKEYI